MPPPTADATPPEDTPAPPGKAKRKPRAAAATPPVGVPPQIQVIDTNAATVVPPPPPAEASPPAALEPKAEDAPEAPAPPAADEPLPEAEPEVKKSGPTAILCIDVGGTKVKILASGQTEPRKAPTGKGFTPAKLVETVRALAEGWEYEAISLGYPGLVGTQGPRSEPGNLGPGWVGFDFSAAFGMPVKVVNDAAMQALGSYEGGRMLFLGLGTGLGSALIVGNLVVPLELGRLAYDTERTLGEVLGRRGMEKAGKGEWRKAVLRAVTTLMGAFVTDYVVIGGGNAKHVKEMPPGTRLGHNLTAFRGGVRLWGVGDTWVLAASGGESPQPSASEALRMI